MEKSYIIMIMLQVILIALNAIFASAEIAVISMNDSRLTRLAAQGDKRAVRLARLTSQPARFLATIQVAITLSGFLGSAFAAENFSDGLVEWLVSRGIAIPVASLEAVAVVLITIVLSYFTLIFGELVPKRVAMQKAEALALGMSSLISAIAKLFAPLVWFLTISTNVILRLLGIDPEADGEEVSEEEICMMVDVGSEKGAIDVEEKEFIKNVFEFDDLTAGSIAVHRTEVSLLWMDETMEDWENTIHESRHTRYPVCNGTADQIVGILNAKDYFRLEDRSQKEVMRQAVRPAYFVPDSVKADILFRNMKQSRNSFAVVLDEYGGMIGILTIYDLVEQLVGELGDDGPIQEEEELIRQIDPGTWEIRGGAELDKVAETLGVPLPDSDYSTLNGLIFSTLGAIPEDGTTVELETSGLTIKSTRIKSHQVETAIVRLTEPGLGRPYGVLESS